MLEKLPDTEEVQTVEKEIYMIMLEIKEKNSERIEWSNKVGTINISCNMKNNIKINKIIIYSR